MNFYHVDILADALQTYFAGLATPPPHVFYTYKTLAPTTAEKAAALRPFVFVGIPKQLDRSPYLQSGVEIPVLNGTRIAVYVESPLTWQPSAGVEKGGFDAVHLPAVAAVRAFFNDNRSLDVPTALQSVYKTGTVTLRRDSASVEQYDLLADGHRSTFFAKVSAIERSFACPSP